MSKVAVIGHFGIGLNLVNGQTIKTKMITKAIEEKLEEKAYIIDAHGGIKAIIPVVLGCISALKKCDNIILMLTENGLKVSVPTLLMFNRIFGKRLHYVVIGGWLPNFLDSQPGLEKLMMRFYKIYVETNTMQKALTRKGFNNVTVLHNCKELAVLSDGELVYQKGKPLKICTFSRVMKEKGIETLIDAVNVVNAHSQRYKLDIFGQVDSHQVEWFEELRSKFPPEICYRGVIPFNKSVEIIKNYYMLIFPTSFFTEGIPGTIIDGYAAGVPVLSAKWESYSDVVDDNITGIGYEFDNQEALIRALIYCAENVEVINRMKKKCLTKSNEFTIDFAMQVLFNNLI